MPPRITLGAAILLCAATAVSAQDVTVPGMYPTIQSGIDNVGPGGTVFVDPGVYTESLLVDPMGQLGPARGQYVMRIEGTGPGVVVQWAAGAHALPAAALTDGGFPTDYILLAKGGILFDVDNLEFDGLDDITTGGGVKSGAVFYLRTSGTISNCDIHNFQVSPTSGLQSGLGIYAEGLGAVVNIVDCTMSEIQKGYVLAWGDSTTNLTGCTLTGRGATTSIAQNGVQYGGTAAIDGNSVGTIDDCTFEGFWYTGGTWLSAGVLVWNGGLGIQITNSIFDDCQAGVYVAGGMQEIGTTVEDSVFTQVTPWTTGLRPTGVVVNDGNIFSNYTIAGNHFAGHARGGITLESHGGTIIGNHFDNNGTDSGDNARDNTNAAVNIWDGNIYSDFAGNPGYPSMYYIPGGAGAVDGNPQGLASTTLYGTVNPVGSMLALGGPPKLGTTHTLGVDNPLGTQGAGSFALLFYCSSPDPNYPNGTILTGYGMDGGDGELLINLATEISSLTAFGAPWGGPGFPITFDLNIPPDPYFVGLGAYAQAVMVDHSLPVPPWGSRFTLTRGARILIGY
jgi:hypothetical protein